MTILFSEMVPLSQEMAPIPGEGTWYGFRLESINLEPKSGGQLRGTYAGYRDMDPGFRVGPVPAGMYTIEEINADIDGYARTTDKFLGYEQVLVKAGNGEEEPAAQSDDPMTIEIGVSRDWKHESAYAGFTNTYVPKAELTITKKLGEDSEEVEIPAGTTFTVTLPRRH